MRVCSVLLYLLLISNFASAEECSIKELKRCGESGEACSKSGKFSICYYSARPKPNPTPDIPQIALPGKGIEGPSSVTKRDHIDGFSKGPPPAASVPPNRKEMYEEIKPK